MHLIQGDDLWGIDPYAPGRPLLVTTSRDELATLASAIGHTLELIEEWEYQTLIGVTPEEAEELLLSINRIVRATPEAT